MKNILLSTILFVITVASVFGQSDTEYKPCNPDLPFVILEVMPIYRGGHKQLEADLNNRLEFDKKIDGSIYVQNFINCQGKFCESKVIMGIDTTTDSKLVTELKKLQNWISGSQNGKKVDCRQVIGFKIKNGKLTWMSLSEGNR